jgi:putative transposase
MCLWDSLMLAILRGTIAMARAYSDDLRCKFLAAYERGDGSLRELSVRFGVSLPYAKKIRQQLLRSGKMERTPQPRYGPVSRVTAAAEALLRERVRATPDATLAELRHVLWEQLQIAISRSHMGRLLHRMQLRLKKSHSTPPSKTPKRGGASAMRGGSR